MKTNKSVSSSTVLARDNRVAVGSQVVITLNQRPEFEVCLGEPRQADPERGIVSYESPLGKSLVNKAEGEEFHYAVEGRVFVGRVIKIIQRA